MLQYVKHVMQCSSPGSTKTNKLSKTKDRFWQVFIHIAINVFMWQTSQKESLCMASLGLILVCHDVIACLIHGLEKGNLFMRVKPFSTVITRWFKPDAVLVISSQVCVNFSMGFHQKNDCVIHFFQSLWFQMTWVCVYASLHTDVYISVCARMCVHTRMCEQSLLFSNPNDWCVSGGWQEDKNSGHFLSFPHHF